MRLLQFQTYLPSFCRICSKYTGDLLLFAAKDIRSHFGISLADNLCILARAPVVNRTQDGMAPDRHGSGAILMEVWRK